MKTDRRCIDCGVLLPSSTKRCEQCRLETARKRARDSYIRKSKDDYICKDCGVRLPSARKVGAICVDCRQAKEVVRGQKRYLQVKNSETEKERQRIRARVQRHKERGLPADLRVADWRRILAVFDNKCAYCGSPAPKLVKEHFIPKFLGGGLTKNNIVPACPSCNADKSSKHPLDWLIQKEHGLVIFSTVNSILAQ